MLFKLIKENEIWIKSHGAYLQKYTTCADGIAQTRCLSQRKFEGRDLSYAEKRQMHVRYLHEIINSLVCWSGILYLVF
jgi:hypothetical protein